MEEIWIVLIIIAALGLLVLLAAFVCFYLTFYSPKPKNEPEFPLPDEDIYKPYHEQMIAWQKEMRSFPQEQVEITSFDGLKLTGTYYEFAPNAPIELMFHGYRGSAIRDLCGGVQRCFRLSRSALIVNQRGSGTSEGRVISFGINERKDCLSWINFMLEKFGPEVKIIITGISMGASTVMMASELDLPKNVIGGVADCGYSSIDGIIKKTIQDMGLPPKIAYPFVKLGARIFGKFDLEEASPKTALKNSKVPFIFVHGDADHIVPCEMCYECYEACSAPKLIHIIPNIGHGLAFPADEDGYIAVLKDAEKIYKAL